jgi:hypothetical protein
MTGRMTASEVKVAFHDLVNDIKLCSPNWSYHTTRNAHYHASVGDYCIRHEHRTRGDQAAFADFATVQNDRTDPDQSPVPHPTAVNNGSVPDGHVVANIEGHVARGVQDRTVLDIDPTADPNRGYVASNDDMVHYGGLVAKNHVSGHVGRRSNVDLPPDTRTLEAGHFLSLPNNMARNELHRPSWNVVAHGGEEL